MAVEIIYKQMTRKADKGLEGNVVAKHGKQTNQNLKPYVVLEYLMKYSDEKNTKSAYDIIGYLEGCGISAERRSIYRDIEDIDLNEVDMMFEEAAASGDDAFKKIDLKTRVFSMFGGEQRLVEIRFINSLLDAVVDRFGTKDVQYARVDDTHFSVTAKVEISEQFFGWILGFGKKRSCCTLMM